MKAPFLGVAFGFGAFILSFSQIRPNRIASGEGVYAWEALSVFELALLLVPLILCFVLALRSAAGTRAGKPVGPHAQFGGEGDAAGSVRDGPRSILPLACGVSGNFLICYVFYLSGRVARSSTGAENAFARVSVGFGAWMLVLAGYILVLYALEEGSLKRSVKLLFSLGGIAVLLALTASGFLDEISVFKEFAARKDRFYREFSSHLFISGATVGVAVLIGIPLGIFAFRNRLAERPIFFAVNTVQTIPSLALFGILIAPLAYLSQRFPFLRQIGIRGVGAAPALIALTLYALLPITRNTYASLKVIDPAIPEAGRGMGMGKAQLLFFVEIPMSIPIILSGMRVSLVQAIGNATVAALIGAGGFGVFVFQGLGQAVPDLILLGALPVVILAILTDRVMGFVVRLVTPKGLVERFDEGGAR